VRSIRIARTLADRFRVLLANRSSDFGELELAIGEAQQIYPVFGRHLDEARTALIDMGRDVSAFDALRAQELGHLGVTQVEAETKIDYTALMVGALRIHTVKKATFNLAGYQRAAGACRALMNVMPEVDFKALARAEDRQIAAIGSLHAGKWLGIGKWLAIGAGLATVAYVVYAFATNSGGPSETSEGRRLAQEDQDRRDRARERDERELSIRRLHRPYLQSCDPAVRPHHVSQLRIDHASEAAKLEAAPCSPRRPSCAPFEGALTARFADELKVDAAARELTCDGVHLGAPTGTAFVVTVHTDAAHLRGVVSVDGTKDLVAFSPIPSDARLAKLGNIDRDYDDELVFGTAPAPRTPRTIFVTDMAGGAFVDIPGPAMQGACNPVIGLIAHDAPESDVLRLRLTDDAPRSCGAPGEHYYDFVDGAFVEHAPAP
jgi:hypothetical protein